VNWKIEIVVILPSGRITNAARPNTKVAFRVSGHEPFPVYRYVYMENVWYEIILLTWNGAGEQDWCLGDPFTVPLASKHLFDEMVQDIQRFCKDAGT